MDFVCKDMSGKFIVLFRILQESTIPKNNQKNIENRGKNKNENKIGKHKPINQFIKL